MNQDFKWRDGVEVRDDDQSHWRPALFIGMAHYTPGRREFVCQKPGFTPTSYLQCRKPRPHFEVDEPVLVKESKQISWCRRHFAGWSSNGKPRVFQLGATSWSAGEQAAEEVWDEIKKKQR